MDEKLETALAVARYKKHKNCSMTDSPYYYRNDSGDHGYTDGLQSDTELLADAFVKCESIIQFMEDLASDGWCVVLKKLPPGFPWIFDDEPKSEYEGSCGARQHEFGRDLWCCEVQDVSREKTYRPREFVTHETAIGAIEKMVKLLGLRSDFR